ncbi:MAG: PAC2 family protein [Conexivisphaera sp.]
MRAIVRGISRKIPKADFLIGAVPGAGQVGKLAVDHLIVELRADLVAEIYTPAFPPQVYIQSDGVAYMPRFQLYHAQQGSRSVLLFTGPSQLESNEASYEVVDSVLEIAKGAGVSEVYSLAAYILGKEPTERAVHGTATRPELLERLRLAGVNVMDGGEINGMNGLIFAMASLKDMDGICLLGETAGYYVDALSSKEVLKALARLSGIEVDYSRLDSLAAEAERAIKAMMDEISRSEAASRDTRPGRMDYIS